MTTFSSGKYALSISDRSGMAFPYLEMVREWNGAWVHFSEYEPKQPQLQPKPTSADPQALQRARPARTEFSTQDFLPLNPFTTASNTTLTVSFVRSQLEVNDVVRFATVQEAVGGVSVDSLQMQTTLNGNITDSATTITLTDASAFPTSGYIVIISTNSTTGLYNSETIQYTGKSSNDLTGCTRGTSAPSYGKTPEKTTAISHTSGAKVYGSYSITKINKTINYPGQPPTEVVSNQYTITLVNNATSTAKGGGYFVFGGPVNDRP